MLEADRWTGQPTLKRQGPCTTATSSTTLTVAYLHLVGHGTRNRVLVDFRVLVALCGASDRSASYFFRSIVVLCLERQRHRRHAPGSSHGLRQYAKIVQLAGAGTDHAGEAVDTLLQAHKSGVHRL